LNQWQIQTKNWILATLSGWCILGISFNYANDNFASQSSRAGWQLFITIALVMLMGGACIGMFQSFAAHKALPKSGLWIVCNMLGVLALFEITSGVMKILFAVKSYILIFLYTHELYAIVDARGLLISGFLLISALLTATVTLFMPTGIVLLKYCVQPEQKDGRVIKTNGMSS